MCNHSTTRNFEVARPAFPVLASIDEMDDVDGWVCSHFRNLDEFRQRQQLLWEGREHLADERVFGADMKKDIGDLPRPARIANVLFPSIGFGEVPWPVP